MMELPKKSRVKSVSMDLEKYPTDGEVTNEKELMEADLHDQKRKQHRGLVLTMNGFLFVMIIISTVFMVRNMHRARMSGQRDESAVGFAGSVHRGAHADIVQEIEVSGERGSSPASVDVAGSAGNAGTGETQKGLVDSLLSGLTGKKQVDSSDINFFNVDEIADNDELSKYVEQRIGGAQQQHSKGSAHANSQVHKDGNEIVDPKRDLQEILSVHSIVILADEDTSAPNKQFKFENILMNLNIVPEPKVVNLAKHPHHNDIVAYLKKYSNHESQRQESTSTLAPSDIDLSHRIFNENNEDIPRLFVGGHPLANYDDVFNKYESKELADFLREHGKGMLTID